jgi:alpha-galactosidase/6-phospho-beta-glucosidase family protein
MSREDLIDAATVLLSQRIELRTERVQAWFKGDVFVVQTVAEAAPHVTAAQAAHGFVDELLKVTD